MKRFLTVLVIAGSSSALVACGPTQASSPAPTIATSPSPSASAKPHHLLCDPGLGAPQLKATCPDPEPETGWVAASGGELLLSGFTTLRNDAVGRAHAEKHGREFPFPNDYFDAPTGTSRTLTLTQDAICTGAIRVGYVEPLHDHVVPCADLAAVAQARRMPVAVWTHDGAIVQLSELYRP